MADPSSYRPAPGTIPLEPGVYKFRDGTGRVIYVGKAKSLRSRLNSYFADPSALHPRTRQMVYSAASVEWTIVNTEVEALQLEFNWIKEFDPRFNVRYRDDKSYPSLAVTLNEEFPRLQVMRGPKKPGVRYFGPYAHAWAIRETLDLLLRVFPARTCSAGVFKRAGQIGRPCLLGYIGKCSAPCVGRVSAEQHRAIVEDFCDFMAGKTDTMVRRLEKQMAEASADLEFEKAARLRDDLGALRRSMEKQAVVLSDGADADVVAFATDELSAAVQVFHVREGRVRGQRGWVVEAAAGLDPGTEQSGIKELVEQFVLQFYGQDDAVIPREVLVPELPDDHEALAELLAEIRGSRVSLRVPQRGDKRSLMQTVQRNAEQSFVQYKLRRASDLTARSQALAELQEALDMPDAPLRIECFDISHVQGTNVVASMVVFEDGLARKSEYRRFAMRESGGDVDWIAEVIRRRFARYLSETGQSGEGAEAGDGPTPPATGVGRTAPANGDGRSTPLTEDGRPKKFAYPPNLVVVDGGAPQVAAAQAVLSELGITDVTLVGLAKRLEEVWLPDDDHPVILPRSSEALYLLQRVRDEAHRFAITFHRQKRSKSMTASELTGIAGLGPARRKALLARFGSLRKLRAASVDEIAGVSGIGPELAQRVVEALAAGAADREPAVNMATGEVIG
ncbi:MAG: excinuclease ABC subunit UvrC [Actinobacteria bacterium]|nr:excinuclease ABC subunit UvrC [Actinomycetota bacterium]